jgi:DNA-directed RNA polymerase subunit RPC12/RpoP
MSTKEREPVYQCATCGVVTAVEGHLCSPRPVKEGCYRSGPPAEDVQQVCDPMRGRLQYVCETCGRLGEQAHLLCRPRKTEA